MRMTSNLNISWIVLPVYNYYDSSTGWSKLLIYSGKENQFLSTKKIDEGVYI